MQLLSLRAPAPAPARSRASRPRRRDRADRWRRRLAVTLVALVTAAFALIGAPASAQTLGDCKQSPEVQRPGSGLVGNVDPPTRGRPGTAYGDYSYAGLVWNTYDLGCGPSAVIATEAVASGWVGSRMFDLAKLIVAGTNSAHYTLNRSSEFLAPFDRILQRVAQSAWSGVFLPFVSVALMLLAVFVFWRAQSGAIAPIAAQVAVAVLALGVASLAAAHPDVLYKPADTILVGSTNQISQGFLEPTGQGDADTLPTVLTDRLIYDNWVRGEVGSTTAPQARLLPQLLRDQAFSKQEIAAHQDGADQSKAKQADFQTVAGQMSDRYTTFQGKTDERAGIGALALFQTLCVALFQLAALGVVLASMLLLRLLVVLLPVIAVVGVVYNPVFTAALRVGGLAIVTGFLTAAIAGVHAQLSLALLDETNGMPPDLAYPAIGFITILLWSVMRPFKRLLGLAEAYGRWSGIGEGSGGINATSLATLALLWRRGRSRGGRSRERLVPEGWWGERGERPAAAGADPGEEGPGRTHRFLRYTDGWRYVNQPGSARAAASVAAPSAPGGPLPPGRGYSYGGRAHGSGGAPPGIAPSGGPSGRGGGPAGPGGRALPGAPSGPQGPGSPGSPGGRPGGPGGTSGPGSGPGVGEGSGGPRGTESPPPDHRDGSGGRGPRTAPESGWSRWRPWGRRQDPDAGPGESGGRGSRSSGSTGGGTSQPDGRFGADGPAGAAGEHRAGGGRRGREPEPEFFEAGERDQPPPVLDADLVDGPNGPVYQVWTPEDEQPGPPPSSRGAGGRDEGRRSRSSGRRADDEPLDLPPRPGGGSGRGGNRGDRSSDWRSQGEPPDRPPGPSGGNGPGEGRRGSGSDWWPSEGGA